MGRNCATNPIVESDSTSDSASTCGSRNTIQPFAKRIRPTSNSNLYGRNPSPLSAHGRQQVDAKVLLLSCRRGNLAVPKPNWQKRFVLTKRHNESQGFPYKAFSEQTCTAQGCCFRVGYPRGNFRHFHKPCMQSLSNAHQAVR